MSTQAFLVSGSGNDFLALVEPKEDPAPEVVRAWCRRGISIGVDGVFVLARTADPRVVRMDYWNADGTAASLCGNGTRCAAELAFELGWAVDEVSVETGAGTFAGRRVGPGRVELEAPLPAATLEEREVEALGGRYRGYWTRVGVPYFVIPWTGELRSAPVQELGPVLRHHPSFAPDGVNVDFVLYPLRDRLEMRVYERGVEAETLASGTGILAAALIGLATGRLELPVTAETESGFPAVVRGDLGPDRLPRRWSLEGDARLVARIEPLPGALVQP